MHCDQIFTMMPIRVLEKNNQLKKRIQHLAVLYKDHAKAQIENLFDNWCHPTAMTWVLHAGIPIAFPGEVIDETSIAYLKHVLDMGGKITGAYEGKLDKFSAIKESR